MLAVFTLNIKLRTQLLSVLVGRHTEIMYYLDQVCYFKYGFVGLLWVYYWIGRSQIIS